MNWIDALGRRGRQAIDRGQLMLLRSFWWSTLVPTALLAKRRGKTYLREADPTRTSNWQAPDRTIMTPEDFETGY